MPATVYAVPASHPCVAVERALELKGIDYRTVHLVPVFHKLHQRVRFREASTVPGVVFEDGRRLIGSRAIMAELERMRPEPPLWPSEPAARVRVQEAEAWGDEVLQPLVRRVLWTALSRDTAAQLTYAEGARLVPPVPAPVARLSGGAVAWAEKRINGAREDDVRADLQSLPGHLDRVERWLGEGLLGGEPPNAADLQVATGLRLLTTLDDLHPMFDRPAGEYARRMFEHYPGRCAAGALAHLLP